MLIMGCGLSALCVIAYYTIVCADPKVAAVVTQNCVCGPAWDFIDSFKTIVGRVTRQQSAAAGKVHLVCLDHSIDVTRGISLIGGSLQYLCFVALCVETGHAASSASELFSSARNISALSKSDSLVTGFS